MLKIRHWTFLSLFLLTHFCSLGQTVNEPTYHTVYSYLSRISQRGIIDINDIVLPLSKDYIYSKLDELSKKIDQLTPLERDELSFYLKEYTLWWRNDPKTGFEGDYKSILQSRIGDRFRIFAFQNKDFSLNIQPILGFQNESRNGYGYYKNWKGFWVYGYFGKAIGYSLDFRASSESGNIGDYLRLFSPETGVIGVRTDYKTFDYNEFNASISAKWKWGKIILGKDYLQIGYGQGGKVIMSNKAPSFPMIRIDVNPTNWLSFLYAHGWLNSLIVDSTSIYSTPIPNRMQYQYRNKFIAIHSVSLSIGKKIKFMVGESAVYSDKLRIEYLIPISLFSAASHYMGELENNSVSNSQIFTQISFRNLLKNTHIYGSFFIDELRLKQWGNDTTSSRNHTAYTLGVNITDVLIPNLTATIEYTKIQPFAYIHFLPVQTYMNNGYNLGHWIGPNADQLFFQLRYRLMRGLTLDMIYEYIRKGTVGSAIQQVYDNKELFPFLWGDVRKIHEFQVKAQYEILHDLFVSMKYSNQYIESPQYNNNTTNDVFSIGLNFGF